MPKLTKGERGKSLSQSKINAMVLDILEDIAGQSGVYSYDLGVKVSNLNTYLYFGKTLKEISQEIPITERKGR